MSYVDKLTKIIGVTSLDTLPRDVSAREYFRGHKDGRDFIVMLYPDASDEDKVELSNFIDISNWVAEQGCKAPELYELYKDECFALFEDLGVVSFGTALREKSVEQEEVYTLGTGILMTLAGAPVLNTLPDYKDGAIHENRRQFVDYYMAYKRAEPSNETLVQSYLDVWRKIEAKAPPCPQGFVHGDFHLENIMWQAQNSGIKRGALIDYQDAMIGPLPYDLVNLLEDARIDVPDDLRIAMIERYCGAMDLNEKTVFLQWYRILGTQFHGRVLGLFLKLAAEQGRDSYLIHIERLQNYMAKALDDPILAPLKRWFEKEELDFAPLKDLHGDHIRSIFEKFDKE